MLSTREVAERLNVSTSTVKRWIKEGKLDAYQMGRDYKVEEISVVELMEKSK